MPESHLVLLCQNFPCLLTFCSTERSIPTRFLNITCTLTVVLFIVRRNIQVGLGLPRTILKI